MLTAAARLVEAHLRHARVGGPLRLPPRGDARLTLSVVVAAALLVGGCGKGDGAAGRAGPGGMGAGAVAGPPVGVVTVQLGTVALGTELPGRLEARRTAQVRARVGGIVQQRLFDEGSIVQAGQPLYVLDADASRAALASAQAQSAKAAAAVAQAEAQVERNRPLAEARAISQQEWLATQTALKQAQADAAATKAAIDAAGVSVRQATITAPIGGRIGRSLVSEGALVGPADPSPMAVIQQTHPLFVNFTQSAADVLKLSRAADAGQIRRTGLQGMPVKVLLEDGSEYPAPAKLLFADPTVDATTGQLTLRAEVPNPRGVLLPGLYVRVVLDEAVSDHAVKLPQQAVTRDAAGDTVLVVGADNKPQPRPVKITGASGADWVVTGGLNSGDRVIVDGVQKLQMMPPGTPVTPVPWTPQGARAGAPGAASSGPAASGPAPAVGSPSPAASAASAAAAMASGR